MSLKEISSCGSLQNSSTFKNNYTTYKTQFNDLDDEPCDVACLLCESLYTLPTNKMDFLTHLFEKHQLIISYVEKIASLKSYIRYWRMKFKESPITQYCTKFTINNGEPLSEDNKSNLGKFYYLLSDCLTEDRTVRYEIHQAKLEWILSEQVKERADTTFKRDCMFCRMKFSGSRIEYINHLFQKHNIILGRPENLVFIDKYLDKIQNNIESLICIYCEKKFKDRKVLREHMRKKRHSRVNPNNKIYDKYYISNYLPEQVSHDKQRHVQDATENEDASGFNSNNEDDNWSDWKNESVIVTCLFCKNNLEDFKTMLQHMKLKHNFDFEDICKKFTFYQKVQVVNYIRKQMHTNRCVYCDANIDNLNSHMDKNNHHKLPDMQIWNQPEFYFPMFESDSFLYNLDTNSDDDEII